MRTPDDQAAHAAAALEPLRERFAGRTALIFASGPSLTALWSKDRPLSLPAIAVNDAYRIVPTADINYATDSRWWRYHLPKMVHVSGTKVGYLEPGAPKGVLHLPASGVGGYDERPGWLRHGFNSGYAATHLAVQLGANPVVLCAFDMRDVGGKPHWFGAHPRDIEKRRMSLYASWIKAFGELAEALKGRTTILNATPNSALTCFPSVDLDSLCPDPAPSFASNLHPIMVEQQSAPA